jgi:hypothetical protein
MDSFIAAYAQLQLFGVEEVQRALGRRRRRARNVSQPHQAVSAPQRGGRPAAARTLRHASDGPRGADWAP